VSERVGEMSGSVIRWTDFGLGRDK
jgi:hypothetical protein